jgi:hypothetical protein
MLWIKHGIGGEYKINKKGYCEQKESDLKWL